MKKISAVNRDRISTMYVDRKVSINKISNIGRVDSIRPVNNNTSNANENYLFYSGSFYDKLTELKDHYKKFYLNQQDLESTLKKFKEEKDPDGSIKELITLIDELVVKYNLAITSLTNFQDKIGVQYSQQIEKVLSEYQISLGRIGITFTTNLTLSFNSATAQNNLSFNPDYILFLFDHKNGLIRRLFILFRNIKADFQRTPKKYISDDTSSNSLVTGLLMDEKY